MTRKEYTDSVQEDLKDLAKLISFKSSQYGSDNDYAGGTRIGMVLSGLSDISFFVVLMCKHIGYIFSILKNSDKLNTPSTSAKFKDSMLDMHVYLFLINAKLKYTYKSYKEHNGEIDK